MVTVNDLISRWRTLTTDEVDRATIYIDDCEAALHVYAHDRGMDLDEMLEEYEPRKDLYVAIVCDIVKREMATAMDESPAMSQQSRSVNGYQWQGTYLSPGGGLFIKNSELKQLGLLRQKARKVELYEY